MIVNLLHKLTLKLLESQDGKLGRFNSLKDYV